MQKCHVAKICSFWIGYFSNHETLLSRKLYYTWKWDVGKCQEICLFVFQNLLKQNQALYCQLNYLLPIPNVKCLCLAVNSRCHNRVLGLNYPQALWVIFTKKKKTAINHYIHIIQTPRRNSIHFPAPVRCNKLKV